MKKVAIALQYPENAPAPFLVYKGRGIKADKVIEIAKENNVPVVCNPDTAMILSVQEIGECVPVDTYEVLAGIFAFLKRVKEYDRN